MLACNLPVFYSPSIHKLLNEQLAELPVILESFFMA